MPAKLFIVALGANLPSPAGPPRATLEAALAAIEARGLAVTARSRWRKTPAFPPGAGPDFVNGVAILAADRAPEDVLAELHAVERGLGRDRRRRWAPRACDLDLIACGDLVLPDRGTVSRWMALAPEAQVVEAPPALVLPHPRMHERGFVLAPMADVAPDWIHPILGISVAAMLAALPGTALDEIEVLCEPDGSLRGPPSPPRRPRSAPR